LNRPKQPVDVRKEGTVLKLLRSQSGALAAAAILAVTASPAAAAPDAATSARVSEAYGKLPLSFEANEGQADKAVRFLSRGQGYSLFLTPDEAVLRLGEARRGATVVSMLAVGGRRHPRLTGESPLSTRSNYLLGNDPGAWHLNIPSYERVRSAGIYPGVDLVYRGNQGQLEYDFVIAPQADPSRIRLAFRGAESVTLGQRGELILHTVYGDLVQHPPVVYQEAAGRREPVEGRYVLHSGRRGAPRQVGFAVGRYDRTRPLVIDPILGYSTFLGGSGAELRPAIAVDGAGNAYITGHTESTTFPGVNAGSIQPTHGGGPVDAFVTKINATGTAIVYSTYLGSGFAAGLGIAVDAAGNAYVTGETGSTAFPGVNAGSIQPTYGGGPADAFVTKINATGTAIVYSTFLGGSGDEEGLGIAVDSEGSAYVTGQTGSATFPGVNAGSIQPAYGGRGGRSGDGFVTKINPTGTAIVYSTFLGGSGSDESVAIAVDSAGNAYVTGDTASTTFPGVTGSSLQPINGGGTADVFVTKINPTGTAVVYSTFLGGSGDDEGLGIAADGAGNTYVTGWTDAAIFPGVTANSFQPVNGGNGDAFVTKINPTGTAFVYSTFLGGGGGDGGHCIAVDGAGNAYVAGWTGSATFPGVTASSIQSTYGGGGDDVFVTKLNPMGTAIVYSTFLGGTQVDVAHGIAVDGAGNAYVTGESYSVTFTGVDGSSLQPDNVGDGRDIFVTKLSEPAIEFYTLTPCRLVDTRGPAGPLGGPVLQPGATRTFVITNVCGVPPSAKALSVNLTVTQPSAPGYLRLLPGDQAILPAVSSVNYDLGQTRANNAILRLAFDGGGGLQVFSLNSVHFILDVNGYFQ
jgi:hypothetical protein